MESFNIIYKILKILEKSMSLEEFDNECISAEVLRIPYPLWCRILKILADNEYITGIEVWNAMECNYPKVALVRPEITLQGLEYLQENSVMKKIHNAAKGIKEVVPGL